MWRRPRGHADWIWSVNFFCDGKRLLSGSADNTARLWDLTTKRTLITSMATRTKSLKPSSPDEKRIATASNDHTIKLWNAETGQELPRSKTTRMRSGRSRFRLTGKHWRVEVGIGRRDCGGRSARPKRGHESSRSCLPAARQRPFMETGKLERVAGECTVLRLGTVPGAVLPPRRPASSRNIQTEIFPES